MVTAFSPGAEPQGKGSEILTDEDFMAIYRANKDRVLAIVCARLPSESDAEDVLQDAFRRFFEKVQPSFDQEHARRYLIRCVLTAVADWWRLRNRRKRTEANGCHPPGTELAGGDPMTMAIDNEQYDAVRQALASLPDRQHHRELMGPDCRDRHVDRPIRGGQDITIRGILIGDVQLRQETTKRTVPNASRAHVAEHCAADVDVESPGGRPLGPLLVLVP